VAEHHVLFLTDRGERHQRNALRSAPAELDIIMKRRAPDTELMDVLPTVEFIISERAEPVSAQMIAQAAQLKLIVRLGSLMVGIDTEAARLHGVSVSLQPVVGTMYVAEHVLMMTLATLKHLGRSLWQANMGDHGMPARRTDENTFAFNWLGLTDIGGLYGKRVAILGMGEIGVELARRLIAFRPSEVLYNKRTRYPQAVEQQLGITYSDPSDCVQRADILISLLPYAPDTDLSINAVTFDSMKTGAILVHAGSGSVIDEQALVDALKSGKLAGAALDTFEYEPLSPTHPLVLLSREPRSNLLLTPHVAAASLPDTRTDDFSEIMRFVTGEPLRYQVD